MSIDLIGLYIIIFFGAIAAIKWGYNHFGYSKSELQEIAQNSSLLISMYVNNAELTPISDGSLDGMTYHLMVPLPAQNTPNTAGFGRIYGNNMPYEVGQAAGAIWKDHEEVSSTSNMIFLLDLPTPSLVHIAGIGIKTMTNKERLLKSTVDNALERVNLEGDFPDYFWLFCSHGYDIELRQVLDPATMQFLVDFCQKLDWELVGSSLYFISNGSNQKSDSGQSNTVMVEDAQNFAKRVLPVLQRLIPSAASNTVTDDEPQTNIS